MLLKRKMANKSLLFLILTLAACSSMPDWMGSGKKDSGIKGTRISVLNLENSINPDAALSELKILLPEQQANQSWYKSDGHPYLVPANPELVQELPNMKKTSAGKGGVDDQHLTSSPIIEDGKVFTISADSNISAFDALDIKKRIWRTKIKLGDKKEKFSSTAGIAYYNGRIYATTGYNEVVALDAKTGAIIWTRTINSIARSAPDAKDNVIFINTIDNRLYALDSKDGGILWTHTGGGEEISMFGSASPVVYEDVVIAPYSSGEMYTLKRKDGAEIWSDVFARRSISSAKTLSDIDAAPAISHGKVFVISNDGVLAASDIKTGKRMWEQQISGGQSPWIAGDFMYVISNKNELVCLHARSGGIKWIKQLITYKNPDSKNDPIKWSGPVLAGDLLWMVGSHGKLMAVSPHDGSNKYERKVPKDIYIAPVVAYGNIYLYSDDAELIQVED